MALILSTGPNKIGLAIPSSLTICAAFKILKLSASAKTTLFGFCFALLVMAFISRSSSPRRFSSDVAYSSQSPIFFLATPDLIAARATAGATREINRGSTGFGII